MEKVKAIQECKKDTVTVEKILKEIAYYQGLLMAVSPNETDKLQQNRFQTLKERSKSIKNQTISVYINSAELFLGDTIQSLSQKISTELSKIDFEVVNNSSNADFLLNIKATTTENGTVQAYSTSIRLYKTLVQIKFIDNNSNNTVYENRWSETSNNVEENEGLANVLFEKIAKQILNQLYQILNKKNQ
jgi:hypothetical protein